MLENPCGSKTVVRGIIVWHEGLLMCPTINQLQEEYADAICQKDFNKCMCKLFCFQFEQIGTGSFVNPFLQCSSWQMAKTMLMATARHMEH